MGRGMISPELMLDLSLKLMADDAKKARDFLDETQCHCGAVKEPAANECSNCDHHRTEAMQDDLETARRSNKGE